MNITSTGPIQKGPGYSSSGVPGVCLQVLLGRQCLLQAMLGPPLQHLQTLPAAPLLAYGLLAALLKQLAAPLCPARQLAARHYPAWQLAAPICPARQLAAPHGLAKQVTGLQAVRHELPAAVMHQGTRPRCHLHQALLPAAMMLQGTQPRCHLRQASLPAAMMLQGTQPRCHLHQAMLPAPTMLQAQ